MEMKKRKRIGWSDLLLFLVSVLYPVLLLTVFDACGKKDDGTWMTCHWARNTVVLFAVLLTVLSLIHIIFSDPGRKQGISICIIAAAFASMLVPQRVIDLCMMQDMRCRSLMMPGTIVLSILIMAAAVLDIFAQWRRGKRGSGI